MNTAKRFSHFPQHTSICAFLACLIMLLGVSFTAANEELYQRYADRFDPGRAFQLLVDQVEIGPRHPGAPGHYTFREWALQQFANIGLPAYLQLFRATNALSGKEEEGANVIAIYRPEAESHFIMSCHWDSRIYADSDPDPANHKLPVPAANDGGSGVAVLLEVARVLAEDEATTDAGVIFILYDFEDQGNRGTEEWALGSEYFAENIPTTFSIRAAINFDMVADKNQLFMIERHSYKHAREKVNTFWSHGMKRFPNRFTRRRQNFVYDDHIHLLRRGFDSINLIDFNYPAWHTLNDVPEQCSPESLAAAGLTALSYLAYDGRPVSP
jgi:Zn-dependent M28 family amino/carboxypeptidase